MTLLSLIAFVVLLSHTAFSTHLQKIGLKSSAYNPKHLWDWAKGGKHGDGSVQKNADDGVRVVVFGDSWVDDGLDNVDNRRGKGWPKVLCEEVIFNSYL